MVSLTKKKDLLITFNLNPEIGDLSVGKKAQFERLSEITKTWVLKNNTIHGSIPTFAIVIKKDEEVKDWYRG